MDEECENIHLEHAPQELEHSEEEHIDPWYAVKWIERTE
jgi:hypothetical protein